MAKLSDLTLEELYERPKMTPAAIKVIQQKEDFSTISAKYCDKVCDAPCYLKNPRGILLDKSPTDILVLNPYPAMDERWKNGERVDTQNNTIYSYMMNKALRGRPFRWKVSNAFKCRPFAANREARAAVPYGEHMPLPKNPTLTPTKISKCSPYLLEEIYQSDPKIIISTTTEVTKALGLKSVSNSKDRGSVQFIQVKDKTIPVLLTRHPSILTMIRQNSSGDMWGPDYTSMILKDFIKAVELVAGEVDLISLEEALNAIHENLQIAVPGDLDEAIRMCEEIRSLSGKGKIISWDTEATSLDPWSPDARFLMHQFGYRREDGLVQAVVFPLWHKDNVMYDPDELWPHIEAILVDEDIPKVAHNAAFDLKFTRVTTGVTVEGVVADTMLLLHAINSGIQGNYGLKQSVWDHLFHTGLGGYESKLEEEYVARKKAEEAEEKAIEKERLKEERAAERARAKAEKASSTESNDTRKPDPKPKPKPSSDLSNVVGLMERKK